MKLVLAISQEQQVIISNICYYVLIFVGVNFLCIAYIHSQCWLCNMKKALSDAILVGTHDIVISCSWYFWSIFRLEIISTYSRWYFFEFMTSNFSSRVRNQQTLTCHCAVKVKPDDWKHVWIVFLYNQVICIQLIATK